jgi:inhibitor of cysteine peptidase
MEGINWRNTLLGLALALAVVCAACNGPGGGPGPTSVPDEVLVERIDILLLESFPLQVHVAVFGTLPDACSLIDEVEQVRDGNTFRVTMTLARRANARCAPNPTPFEHTVPLDVLGLEAGTYIVDVHGVRGSFELQVENIFVEQ